MAKIDIVPTDAPVGAEIRGVDLADGIDDATFAEIDAALSEYAVIFLRDQHITPQQQVDFSRRFGEIEINAFSKYALEENPAVLVVSNIKENGKDIGYADAGSHWHTDMSYTATPPRLTMLYAVEVPHRDGKPLGDTWFAGAVAAYEDLPDAMKRQLDGKRAIHRFAAKERGVKKPVPLTPEQIAKHPDVCHPVVRRHPVTGTKALYLRKGECIGIEGMPDAEALPLIEDLSDRITSEKYIYRHQWKVGDLLMWDNALVQHWAPRDYEWPDRRMMLRTTVNGSVPI
ncbi:MAG: TauD/TfdA family dioxygenase [Gammaproteobacteria bacterium]|jgi:taurine dioxygenase